MKAKHQAVVGLLICIALLGTLLGWLSLLVVYQLYIHLEGEGLLLLGLGGLIYSLGVIFYVAKRIPYNHAIWHLFVLGGSVCHFMAIYGYVA